MSIKHWHVLAALVAVSYSQAGAIFVNDTRGADSWSRVSVVSAVRAGPKATIQAAIDTAVDSDAAIVAQDEYFQSINFNGGGSGSVVTCTTGDVANTVLSCFVITVGNAWKAAGCATLTTTPR